MNHDALDIGVACVEMALGVASLILGFKGNVYQGGTVEGRLLTRYFAPAGVLWMLAGSFHLLNGHVPDAPLISLGTLGFAANVLWWVRIHRRFKTHMQTRKSAAAPES